MFIVHSATNFAYQSFDSYSHFIEKEVRTMANDLSDAAVLLWGGGPSIKPSLPESNPLFLPV